MKVDTAVLIGPRLQAVAAFIPEGAMLGDIGTDHAYLPITLLQQHKIQKAVGVEINKGPFESAQENVKIHGYQDKITVRYGSGLRPIKVGEVDTISIAGMGGNTILEIMDDDNQQVLEGVNDLIVQPQGAEGKVRQVLLQKGWKMQDELLVEDDNLIYSVIKLNKKDGLSFQEVKKSIEDLILTIKETDLLQETKFSSTEPDIDQTFRTYIWKYGPVIVEKKKDLLVQLLTSDLSRLDYIAQEIMKTRREEIKAKAQKIECERKVLEVMQVWLSQ